MWRKSETQNVTKIKNSKCDKAKKLKMWQNLTTKNLTKIKKKINLCQTLLALKVREKKTKKLKLWLLKKCKLLQNSKTKW